MKNIKIVGEVKFVSKANGGIKYVCAFIKNDVIYYSKEYYLLNGGHRPLKSEKLKEVKLYEEWCIKRGYIYLTRELEEQFKEEYLKGEEK